MYKKNKTIHLLPIILLVIGVSATFFASHIAENYMELFGLLMIISTASLLLGALLGFLFGIPKSNKKVKPGTNLEEISSWLSIMIIGLILTQATRFPFYLESIANSILANNDCIFNCQYAHAIIIGEMIFSAVSGFIIAYSYTRIYFLDLYSILKSNELLNAEIKIWKEGFQKNSKENLQYSRNEVKFEMFKNKSKLASSLTEEELNILKMIAEENNEYVVRKPLSFEEDAAVNVLVEKRLISEIKGGNFRTGATLSIIDESLLEALY